MIRSMTGMGRAQVQAEGLVLSLELRSVNNRSFRASFRLPEKIQPMEQDIEKTLRARLSRGTINVLASLDEGASAAGYEINTPAIRYYRDEAARIGRDLNLPNDVTLRDLIALPGALQKPSAAVGVPDHLRAAVEQALQSALAELIASREAEGAIVWQDMLGRCEAIESLLVNVEKRLPAVLEEYRLRLSDRLGKLLQGLGVSVTEEDVRRELALFADRSNIAEELSRLRGHCAMMRAQAERDEAVGRRLEFIAQEMFREANTMGSKSNDTRLIEILLDVKTEVEKLREQSLNVE